MTIKLEKEELQQILAERFKRLGKVSEVSMSSYEIKFEVEYLKPQTLLASPPPLAHLED